MRNTSTASSALSIYLGLLGLWIQIKGLLWIGLSKGTQLSLSLFFICSDLSSFFPTIISKFLIFYFSQSLSIIHLFLIQLFFIAIFYYFFAFFPQSRTKYMILHFVPSNFSSFRLLFTSLPFVIPSFRYLVTYYLFILSLSLSLTPFLSSFRSMSFPLTSSRYSSFYSLSLLSLKSDRCPRTAHGTPRNFSLPLPFHNSYNIQCGSKYKRNR